MITSEQLVEQILIGLKGSVVEEEASRVDWDAMNEKYLMCSSGEQVLIDMALNVWNGRPTEQSRLDDLFKLDRENQVRVLDVLRAYVTSQ